MPTPSRKQSPERAAQSRAGLAEARLMRRIYLVLGKTYFLMLPEETQQVVKENL